MSISPCRQLPSSGESLPSELIELHTRLSDQPANVRAALEPFVEEAMEGARFRNRVLDVARGALEQFKRFNVAGWPADRNPIGHRGRQ